MDALNWIFGGLGGAVLTAIVAWAIHKQSIPRPSGRAWELLKGLNRVLGKQEGEVYFTQSAQDHYQVAAYLYGNADGKVIGTAFHEDPANYGNTDLVNAFQYGGALFTRITCEEVCPSASATAARTNLENIQRGATLVVIPAGKMFVRFDGIFCRLKDGSHLCLLSFRNPVDPKKNKGVVFRDGMAKNFFEYYESLAASFSRHGGTV
ncbi:MAG: hypothetical protein ABIK28_24925 [Planctomycetota bacterium]